MQINGSAITWATWEDTPVSIVFLFSPIRVPHTKNGNLICFVSSVRMPQRCLSNYWYSGHSMKVIAKGWNSFPPSKTSLRKFLLLFVTAVYGYLRIHFFSIFQKIGNFPSIIAKILKNYQMMFSRTLFSKIIFQKTNNSLRSSTTTALKLFSSQFFD